MNLHAITEALYLAAAILATFGLVVRKPRLSRAAVGALAAGAVVHAAAFLQIHQFQIPPKLTGLPGAVSLAAWLGTLFFLALVRRPRLDALVVIVAPAAFLGAFFGSMAPGAVVHHGAPLWAQAHVLLATAYYRQKKKELGDRHRDIAEKLRAEQQAREPGAQDDLGPAYGGGEPSPAPAPSPSPVGQRP